MMYDVLYDVMYDVLYDVMYDVMYDVHRHVGSAVGPFALDVHRIHDMWIIHPYMLFHISIPHPTGRSG